ncbi:MAG: sulfite exporter TauE/SafE family protein [Ignavibacteriales bacterium]|nr:sulfite exporter TauE/SafE family protein [Ignavibacteriales bacterium]HOJ17689.1 sulfite exporter TauE/SafE family protein [Ignavibacteriaceae bacterium]
MFLFSGFIIGLVGSLHCIGMCGPIVVALPVKGFSTFRLIITRLLYNIGRVITYSFLGLLFGILGKNLNILGLQQITSIVFGAVMILVVITPSKIKNSISRVSVVSSANGLLKKGFSKLISKQSAESFFLIGILNGFLPCGFVYVGIAGALVTGSLMNAVIYMFLFGLGTIPVMFLTSMFPAILGEKKRVKIRKWIPVLLFILGAVFILRGLNLGIPMLSPKDAMIEKKMEQIKE